MKGNCGECERRYTCTIEPNECNEWPDPVPQTNADRIRAMSDEELAEWIRNGISSDSCDYCKHNNFHCDGTPCMDKSEAETIIEWLRQPAKEDGNE